METGLQETKYCDVTHPRIRKLAGQLSENTSNVLQIAQNTFSYVRDRIPYGFDLFRRKASDTLKIGYGVCWNKSLLTMALLRRNGIPAHLGSIAVDRTFVQPTAGFTHRLINQPFNHCFAYAYLNDRWTVLDTVLDHTTYEKCYRPLGVHWGIDWDGINDCRLYTEHILGPPRRHEDVDATIHRRVGNKEWVRPAAILANAFLNRRLWKKTGAAAARHLSSPA